MALIKSLIEKKTFLAPMSGISDPAFRLLCKEHGAGVVVTELKSVHGIVEQERILRKKNKNITEFVQFSREEKPIGIQLFGSEIPVVVKAAKIVEPYFDFIDYNMGCPAPHITKQMAGAALMQHPNHNKEMFTALVKAVKKPVTLKMRAGVKDSNAALYKKIGKLAEKTGVKMLTLHPRTVQQGYSGVSDWKKIKNLKKLVDIPVVGNGDIHSYNDVKKMITLTGCDAVMIGRAARGNPYLFDQINKEDMYEVTASMKLDAFKKYVEYAKRFNIAFSDIKTQAMQFTNGIVNSTDLRRSLIQAKDVKYVVDQFEKHVKTLQINA